MGSPAHIFGNVQLEKVPAGRYSSWDNILCSVIKFNAVVIFTVTTDDAIMVFLAVVSAFP